MEFQWCCLDGWDKLCLEVVIPFITNKSCIKGYMYVPPPKVRFLNHFDVKTGIHFAHFGMELGMVFEGTMQVYECIYLSF